MSKLIPIHYYRKMLHIQRIPGVFKTRPYNLAEHSYYVSILFLRFSKPEGIEIFPSTIEAILDHDVLETISTDLPHHVKNLNETTRAAWAAIEREVALDKPAFEEVTDTAIERTLNPLQKKLFKACDLLELWIYCKEETLLGNNSVEIKKILQTCERYLTSSYRFETIISFMEEWTDEYN